MKERQSFDSRPGPEVTSWEAACLSPSHLSGSALDAFSCISVAGAGWGWVWLAGAVSSVFSWDRVSGGAQV